MLLILAILLLTAVASNSSNKDIEIAKYSIVGVRWGEVHDDLDERHNGHKKGNPVFCDEINHGTKLHNSVQPSDAARLARVAVDVDEVLAYTYAVEAGLEEALQN